MPWRVGLSATSNLYPVGQGDFISGLSSYILQSSSFVFYKGAASGIFCRGLLSQPLWSYPLRKAVVPPFIEPKRERVAPFLMHRYMEDPLLDSGIRLALRRNHGQESLQGSISRASCTQFFLNNVLLLFFSYLDLGLSISITVHSMLKTYLLQKTYVMNRTQDLLILYSTTFSPNQMTDRIFIPCFVNNVQLQGSHILMVNVQLDYGLSRS